MAEPFISAALWSAWQAYKEAQEPRVSEYTAENGEVKMHIDMKAGWAPSIAKWKWWETVAWGFFGLLLLWAVFLEYGVTHARAEGGIILNREGGYAGSYRTLANGTTMYLDGEGNYAGAVWPLPSQSRREADQNEALQPLHHLRGLRD